MVATSTAPNLAAPFFDAPRQPPPTTPADRQAVLSDAVFAAVAALQGLLTHSDPKVVMRAAEMILNLETTRQRHGRPVIGMGLECGPHTACADHTPDIPLDDLPDEPDDPLIEVVRTGMQEDADEKDTGEVASWAQAKQAARGGLTLLRDGFRPGDGALIAPSEPHAYTRTVLPPSSPFPPP